MMDYLVQPKQTYELSLPNYTIFVVLDSKLFDIYMRWGLM